MTDAPESPADRRPDDEPYYIDSECPECGTTLVYYHEIDSEERRMADELADPEVIDDDAEPWYDEFVCPTCLDGIHMDWPDRAAEEIDES